MSSSEDDLVLRDTDELRGHSAESLEPIFLRLLRFLQDMFRTEAADAEEVRAALDKVCKEEKNQERAEDGLTPAKDGDDVAPPKGKEVEKAEAKDVEMQDAAPDSGGAAASSAVGVEPTAGVPFRPPAVASAASSAAAGPSSAAAAPADVPTKKTLQRSQSRELAAGARRLETMLEAANVGALWECLDHSLTDAAAEAAAKAAKDLSAKGPQIDISRQMPLIEALFLVHTDESDESDLKRTGTEAWMQMEREDSSAEQPDSHRTRKLKNFSEKHSKAINAHVHQHPAILNKSLAPIVRFCPNILDFQNKRT